MMIQLSREGVAFQQFKRDWRRVHWVLGITRLVIVIELWGSFSSIVGRDERAASAVAWSEEFVPPQWREGL